MDPGWHERGNFALLEQSQLSPRHRASNRNASGKRALSFVLGSPARATLCMEQAMRNTISALTALGRMTTLAFPKNSN
jgi:hypothetical protein